MQSEQEMMPCKINRTEHSSSALIAKKKEKRQLQKYLRGNTSLIIAVETRSKI